MTEQAIGAAYAADGYVLLPGALAAADLEPARAFIAAEVDRYARVMVDEGKLQNLHQGEPFGRRLAAICRELELSPRNWIGTSMARELYDLFTHRRILRALAAILGPEVTQLGALNIRTKLPESEITSFPWHQDSHYYNEPVRGERVGSTEHAHIVTVWVPLVEATEDNGCLWVIPGSHQWGLIDAARGADMNVRTNADVEQRGTPTPLPMAAGDILLLSNLTFHASKLNRTDSCRWSVDFRYHASPHALSGRARAAVEELGERLRAGGRVPLQVLGAGTIPSWDEWQAATRRAREQAGLKG